MGVDDAVTLRQRFQATLTNPEQGIDLEEARKLYVVTTFLHRSTEAWKFAQWAMIGLRIEREIDRRCLADQDGISREHITHQVRMQFYAFKGPAFVLQNSHRQFLRRAKALGEVADEYGFAVMFSDAMHWRELHLLSNEDMRVVRCAKESGHCAKWKQIIPNADMERLLSLM